ncbi:AraC family transcriptional regulator [Sphaerisporangium melleum]|uniref:AraC family transcriptional regulator n=1 Tax=Sphaerisporangium melleum TaxID=321316 RepID=A0A917VVM3_9ACTN|nr:AraC family transcriptional regulator [Sphaerisporangium melleum]GII74785.1 AraC family transcriptional regulator [Sphaerisporangium melleum]
MGGDWSRYWRAGDRPLEAMHAHFTRHVYHRHSHDTYSFGMTEEGAQSFTCRGEARTSAAGMVMVFNPEDPHDGHATYEAGFTYRMVHIGPELIAEVLGEAAGGVAGLPLFPQPVLDDRGLAGLVGRLHSALVGDATVLLRDELLDSTVVEVVRRGARGVMSGARAARLAGGGRPELRTARMVRELLHDADDGRVSARDLAAAAGRSRFAVYRSFREAYGMAPSDYQRQLRLRTARRLLSQGYAAADAAAVTGFTDQAHLTRWFSRYYGITPGAYRKALTAGG